MHRNKKWHYIGEKEVWNERFIYPTGYELAVALFASLTTIFFIFVFFC